MDAFFDKIYFINLESAVRSKKTMIDLFERHNIKNYQIITATDPKKIDRVELINLKKYAYPGNTFFCNSNCSCLGKGHELSNEEIANSLSHYKVWKDILNNNYKKCLILEDNTILKKDVNKAIEDISKNIPINWNILYLGHSENIEKYKNRNFPKETPFFFKTDRGFGKTNCYAITNNMTKKLKDNLFPLRASTAGFISHFIIGKCNIPAHLCVRDIAYSKINRKTSKK